MYAAPTHPRERLLDAAETLMLARGYRGVGVAELCEAADLRKGSFYHCFPSKAALALRMLERSWDRTRTQLFADAFDDDQRSAVEAFTRYGELLAERLTDHDRRLGVVPGCPFGNFASELARADDDVRDCVTATFDAMVVEFAAVVRRGQDRGDVHAGVDADHAALAVLAQMQGLMVLAKARRDATLLRCLGPDVSPLIPPPKDQP